MGKGEQEFVFRCSTMVFLETLHPLQPHCCAQTPVPLPEAVWDCSLWL